MRNLCRSVAYFVACAVLIVLSHSSRADSPQPNQPTSRSELLILGKLGDAQITCPLQHTSVQADINGLTARVHVRQIFRNPLPKAIEAVYVFPLPQDAAVDDMTMQIGERVIKALIKPREEARQLYEAARTKGQTASLLDQERPNIFTQSVANIAPGAQVIIEISYLETVKLEDGQYQWTFPTVVGPRYMPGAPTGSSGSGTEPDTTQVPDASKISPPVLAPTTDGPTRSGHDIDLQVNIALGQSSNMKLREIQSDLHAVKITNTDSGATVALVNKKEIPNRDFVLRYRTNTDEISDSILTDRDERGQFFAVQLQPPLRVVRENTLPRELVFVLDTSGSMSGFPIEKAKAVMKKAIDNLGPRDEFNLITFAGDTRILWETPRPATKENLAEAQKFLAGQQGGGGTEMMKAINAALEGQDKDRLRVVCFMTDGYVGNDMAIVDAVKKNAGTARVFSFGIGNSVNHFLLDNMAAAGRGAVDYVLLASDADAAANRFFGRINAPVLTDISLDWGNLPVTDTFPKQIPDLFSASPISVVGQLDPNFNLPKESTVTIHGTNAAGRFERKLKIKWNTKDQAGTLPTLWARQKTAYLMAQNWTGLQNGQPNKELKEEITALGLSYRIMTPFTSFVAVEDKIVNVDGKPLIIPVPVEIPDGVSYAGIFGDTLTGYRDRGIKTHFGIGAPFGGPSGAAGATGAAGAAGPPTFNLPAPRISAHGGVRNDLFVVDDGIPLSPTSKLAGPLLGLAVNVQQKGQDGNYTEGKISVKNYRVRIKIFLARQTPELTEQLKQLGYEKQWEAEGVRLIIGTIDVRKLEELSKLADVTRIEAVPND